MTVTSPLRQRVQGVARRATLSLVAGVILVSSVTGCFTQRVPYGSGGTGASQQEFNQWFILWGLVPITQIESDVTAAVGTSSDFTVVSEFTPVDVLINIFTSFVTVYRKSIIIEK